MSAAIWMAEDAPRRELPSTRTSWLQAANRPLTASSAARLLRPAHAPASSLRAPRGRTGEVEIP